MIVMTNAIALVEQVDLLLPSISAVAACLLVVDGMHSRGADREMYVSPPGTLHRDIDEL